MMTWWDNVQEDGLCTGSALPGTGQPMSTQLPSLQGRQIEYQLTG